MQGNARGQRERPNTRDSGGDRADRARGEAVIQYNESRSFPFLTAVALLHLTLLSDGG